MHDNELSNYRNGIRGKKWMVITIHKHARQYNGKRYKANDFIPIDINVHQLYINIDYDLLHRNWIEI